MGKDEESAVAGRNRILTIIVVIMTIINLGLMAQCGSLLINNV
jgi:hypothetical protein